MKKTRVKVLIGTLLILGVSITLFASISSENMTYYYTPDEVLNKPENFSTKNVRMMGLVVKGSVNWDPTTTSLAFQLTDDANTFVHVNYVGAKPDMFREGQGVVVEGVIDTSHTFQATSLLVKHSEEYRVEDHKEKKETYYKSLANI